MRVNQVIRSVAGIVLLGLLSISANGNVIGLNQCVGGVCGGTLDTFTNLPGTLLGTAVEQFTAYDGLHTARYSGELRSAVYRNAANKLDFYYQLSNSSGSAEAVARLTMTSFGGFTTDVGTRMDNWDGAGIFRTAVQNAVSADRDGGGTLGFQFGRGPGTVGPGEVSATMVIRTNAVNYTLGTVTTHSVAGYTMAAYAPSAQIPEPPSQALLGLSLVALAVIGRRR